MTTAHGAGASFLHGITRSRASACHDARQSRLARTGMGRGDGCLSAFVG